MASVFHVLRYRKDVWIALLKLNAKNVQMDFICKNQNSIVIAVRQSLISVSLVRFFPVRNACKIPTKTMVTSNFVIKLKQDVQYVHFKLNILNVSSVKRAFI